MARREWLIALECISSLPMNSEPKPDASKSKKAAKSVNCRLNQTSVDNFFYRSTENAGARTANPASKNTARYFSRALTSQRGS